MSEIILFSVLLALAVYVIIKIANAAAAHSEEAEEAKEYERRMREIEKVDSRELAQLQEEHNLLRNWYAERLCDASGSELTEWERDAFKNEEPTEPIPGLGRIVYYRWLPDRFANSEEQSSCDSDYIAWGDPLFDEAVLFVTSTRRASISGVQRRLKIGYDRAAGMIEAMEVDRLVSTVDEHGNRKVLAPPPRHGTESMLRLAAEQDRFDESKAEIDATLSRVLGPKRMIYLAQLRHHEMGEIARRKWGEVVTTLFNKRQLSRFWDACAEALSDIQSFGEKQKSFRSIVEAIDRESQEESDALAIEGYTRPQFTLRFSPMVFDLSSDVAMISETVDKAQSDFEFVSIYEQKRTTAKLDEVFSHLAENIDDGFRLLADELAAATESLAATIDAVNHNLGRIQRQNSEITKHHRKTEKLAADALHEQLATRKIIEEQARKRDQDRARYR